MKISVILIDWGVRESFHAIEYLNRQETPRDCYELLWVEYFGRRVGKLEEDLQRGRLDRYIVQGHAGPDYSKHNAMNAGVLAATGDIVVIPDSDAMFQPTFISRIGEFFEAHPQKAFLLLDEIRNTNPAYWPFSYPDWDEVVNAPETYNWDVRHKVTKALAPDFPQYALPERLFHANYGACLALRREDYLRHGGLDEHETYIGFVCGVYDLVLRLRNAGFQEHWEKREFLLHTWHPWVQPDHDRIGPNIRNHSTTSLKRCCDGAIMPIVENPEVRAARQALFPETPPAAEAEISILVPQCPEDAAQPLYDSITHSTCRSLEVIFAGEYPRLCASRARYLGTPGQAWLPQALGAARGKWVLLAPATGLFRHGAIDRLLNSLPPGAAEPCLCSTIKTENHGYHWSAVTPSELTGCPVPPLLFERQAWRGSLENLLARAQPACRDDIQLELRLPSQPFGGDEACVTFYARMVELKHAILYGGHPERLPEARRLLQEICEFERARPCEFFDYCLTACLNLTEFYRFIGVFRTCGLTDEVKAGMQLLTTAVPLLVKYGGADWHEIPRQPPARRFNELMLLDIAYYIGSGHFHLGRLAAQQNETTEAAQHFQKCLYFIPGHREAGAFRFGPQPPTLLQ